MAHLLAPRMIPQKEEATGIVNTPAPCPCLPRHRLDQSRSLEIRIIQHHGKGLARVSVDDSAVSHDMKTQGEGSYCAIQALSGVREVLAAVNDQ